MDPNKEQGDGKQVLSLERQIGLVQNSNSIEGLGRFGHALINGHLNKLIDLKLVGFKNFYNPGSAYNPSVLPGDKTLMQYTLEHEKEDKIIWIQTSTDPEKLGVFKIGTSSKPGNKYKEDPGMKTDRGLSVNLNCEYVAEPGRERIRIKEGAIFLHTSDDFYFDAAIVFDGNGTIKDILPSKDYDSDNKNAELMQRAREKVKDRTLAIHAIPALDYLETDLKERGITLSHQRTPGQHDSLRKEVAEMLGVPFDKLFSRKIDPLKTFEAIMNQPVQERPVVRGVGTTAFPPLVFASD